MIQDSSGVDIEALDKDKAYIQITYVKPYYNNYEIRQGGLRQTDFQMNNDIGKVSHRR